MSSYPKQEATEIIHQLANAKTKYDERTRQRLAMSKKRAAARDIEIPAPADLDRRMCCLANPIEFLQTYFAETFSQPFTPDREAMLLSIINAAKYGGDFAIAGPRGEGKTRIAIYGAVYLMVANLSTFPIVIGKSQSKAQNELKTIKERLQQSELFIADFPEIGVPFQAVGGWSSRARMQTVAGKYTNIEIAADHLVMPTITSAMLGWFDVESLACGQVFSCMGIDGPIRGTNHRDKRPTLAILDDIESKESADSDTLIESNEQVIEKDIGGLGQSGKRVSRVMLCTTQNRKCIAYKYTDRSQKPSWNGRRFRKLETPPDRIDLWQKYIELRVNKDESDPDAREAFRFYRDNRAAMEAGCEISNPYSFDDRPHSDGEPLELSALQAYYNRVADFGSEAVATEDDNDPPEEVGPQGSGLTAGVVASRMSGLDRLQVPANAVKVTVGIDVGKYACHWTLTAWLKGGGGVIADYGILEVTGTDIDDSEATIERCIYHALVRWRDELLQSKIVDASGSERSIDAVFIDSGAYSQSIYEFVRQVGGPPFYAVKGVGGYRQPKPSDSVRIGSELHASYLVGEKIWLYNLNADYWKRFVHERFLTPTFNESNMIRPGSLSIFQPKGTKKHISFSQHIVAEEWVSEFKQGKGERCYWMVHNRNNHWLDSTAMSAAAAGMEGISLMTNIENAKLAPTKAEQAKAARPKQVRKRPRHGRVGSENWIQRVRRR